MLDEKIGTLLKDIKQLKDKLREKEKLLLVHLREKNNHLTACKYSEGFTTEQITRYSRQMLVKEICLEGQLKLKNSKVLVVGAGGLGCPVSVYLASAGIGEITIVDYDDVELSNLHRQILHTEDDIGHPKVNSIYDKLHSINRNLKIIPIKQHMDRHTMKQLLDSNKFDVVVDGSDNVATRYLLNDACVLNNLPLVSGSALQLEGQLTVYNYEGGPCYRCLFPVPPPPETVTSCGDGGVLGPVPGIIGVLQAHQTIQILTNSSDGVLSQRFLLFDGSSATFRNVKLRPRNINCDVCGNNPRITELIDYEQFCGAGAHDKVENINILQKTEHIEAQDLPNKLGTSLILDVRPHLQFDLCHLPHTTNLPLGEIEKPDALDLVRGLVKNVDPDSEVIVLCRRGNDSQRAINLLKEKLSDLPLSFLNVRGGLHAYSKNVDSGFPDF